MRPEVEDPGVPRAAGLRDLKCLAEGHTDPQVRPGRARQVGGDELRACPERRLDVQAEPQLDRELVLEGKSPAPRAVSVHAIWHMGLCT